MSHVLKNYRLCLLVIATIVTAVGMTALPSPAGASSEFTIPCHTISYTDGLIPRSTSFGSPSNLFDDSGQLLMQVMCNTRQEARVILGNNDQNVLIYRYALELVDRKYKTIQLTGPNSYGDWIFGRAEAMLSNTGKGSVFAYMCKLVNGVWKCGCRDRACTQAYWQRQEFVALNKDNQFFYDTQQRDSIMQSTNSGLNFETHFRIITDTPVGPVDVQSIAFHPKNRHTLVVVSRDDGLFFRTEDLNLWRPIPFPPQKVYSFLLDTRDPKTRAFATGVINENGRVFRTEDWGDTWRAVYSEPGNKTLITALTQDPHNQNLIIAGTSGGTLVRSTDRGDTWENIGQNIRAQVDQFAHDATRRSFMYMLVKGGKVYHSTDAGITWLNWEEEKTKEIKSLRDEAKILAKEGDREGADRLNARANAIVERNKTEKAPSGIIHISVDPRRSGVLYAGLTKGLYRSKDFGKYWEKINIIESAERFPIKSIAIHPNKSDEISFVAGNAFYRSVNSGLTWSVTPLDKTRNASFVAYDPFTPTTIYVGLSAK